VDTSMGYTPAGGITMGTRSGDLDPGVMLALSKQHDYQALSDLVYHRMGLRHCRTGKQRDVGTAGKPQRRCRVCG